MRSLALIFPACLLAASPALAASGRTFVSGHGVDSGACGPTAPCRGFAYAASQTSSGGEITVLDPAGYGAVTITEALSIVNDGVGEAGVTVSAGNAITINAGGTDVVDLRGLTLVGGGTAGNGIVFNTGGALNVSNSVIRGFTNAGVVAQPSGSGSFNFSDSVVSNAGFYGIYIKPTGSSTTTNVLFNRVQVLGNSADGLLVSGANATGSVQATAVDCVASGNGVGYNAYSPTGQATTVFTIVNSLAGSSTTANSGNGIGLNVNGAKATMVIRHSTVADNITYGFAVVASGTLDSFGDNVITGTNSGTLSSLNLQ